MEARGNAPSYPAQGLDVVRSSLHYGPLPSLTHTLFGWLSSRHAPFDRAFHTYALEWTPAFMRFYVDSRVRHTLHLATRSEKQSFWSRARFPRTAVNGTGGPVVGVGDPWVQGGLNAPFDRREFLSNAVQTHEKLIPFFGLSRGPAFHLVLNLAVGGTSGWFPDGVGGKPWQDQSQSELRSSSLLSVCCFTTMMTAAMYEFALAQNDWYATWPASADDRAFRMCVAFFLYYS
jgi:hypothetical protein